MAIEYSIGGKDFYGGAGCRRGLAIRILYVCLVVKHVICDKMEERSLQIFIPYENRLA